MAYRVCSWAADKSTGYSSYKAISEKASVRIAIKFLYGLWNYCEAKKKMFTLVLEKRGRGKESISKLISWVANNVFDSKALIAIYVNLNPCHLASCLGNFLCC
jgi:hypothetical protein